MLNVLETVFKEKVATPEWQAKIKQIVPSYGTKLNDSAAATRKSGTTPLKYCNWRSHR